MSTEDSRNPTADVTRPSVAPAPIEDQESLGESSLGIFNQVQGQLDALRQMVTQSGRKQADLIAREADVMRRAVELAAREKAFEDRQSAMEGEAARITARSAEVERLLSEVQARSEALAERLSRAEHDGLELESRAAALQEREDQLGTREQELAQREARLQHEAASAGELAAMRSDADQARADLEAERAARQRTEQQSRDAGRMLGEAQELAEAAQKEAAEARARAERAEQLAARANQELDAAQHERHAGEESGAAAHSRVSELESKLSERERELARQAKHLAERDEALREVVHRLREAEEQAEASAALSPKPQADDESVNRVALRRARLARYKRLLAAQSGKIVKAKVALQKRAAECEGVLEQRAKLAEAAAELAEKQRRIEAKSKKSQAAALMLYCVLTIAAVGGVAWGVSLQVAPATFAAKAELAADGKGRTLLPEELSAWANQMTALAQDPMVMAAAAENFSRRGMQSLGTASAVKERFAGMYAQSDKPGSLTLEIRGQGRERTARELETFISAMLSVAGTLRESSGVGAATALARNPTAGTEPLDNMRLIYAGAIGGGGLVLAGIIGGVAYASLRRAKEQFENDAGELSAMT